MLYPVRTAARLFACACLALFTAQSASAQHLARIGGCVYSEQEEPLSGATIQTSDVPPRATSASNNGCFGLRVLRGPVTLSISFVGFETQTHTLVVRGDTSLTITLRSRPGVLGEAVVEGDREEDPVESVQMSAVRVRAEEIRLTPQVLGEVDVLRTLQLQPGVRGGSEASAGLYVRGGGASENLVLLGGLPLYGTTHLFGFMSAFPSAAVSSVRLVKGGFPARYGGRLSSVVDVEMRAPGLRRVEARGSVGLLSSQLALDVPLVRNRVGVVVAARRTYVDVLTRLLASEGFTAQPYFYDTYGSAYARLTARTHVVAHVYASRDAFITLRTGRSAVDEGVRAVDTERLVFGWDNTLASLQVRHAGATTRAEAGLGWVGYDLDSRQRIERRVIEADSLVNLEASEVEYGSRVQDATAWANLDHAFSDKHQTEAGFRVVRHAYTPRVNRQRVNGGSLGTAAETGGAEAAALPSWEGGAYAEHTATFGPVRVAAGLHASFYQTPPDSGQTATFSSVQPRLSARYRRGRVAYKASYAATQQPVHLLVTSLVGPPSELWLPATRTFSPSRARQIALGAVATPSRAWRFSLEGYYKTQRGIIAYRDGAGFEQSAETSWENTVVRGTGRSAGVEVLVEKRTGGLQGHLGYTLGSTRHTFPGINEGRSFPARFDRRHDVALALRYELSPRRLLSATWVYGTGEAVTLPNGQYRQCNPAGSGLYTEPCDLVTTYTARNGARLPAYHRLDLGLQFGYPEDRLHWTVGLYNAYSRRNAFYVTPNNSLVITADGKQYDERYLRRVSLFPILPFARVDFSF